MIMFTCETINAWCRWCMFLLINMTLKKINILEYAFGEGGGGHQKVYAVYAFINVDNCERPLNSNIYFYLNIVREFFFGYTIVDGT